MRLQILDWRFQIGRKLRGEVQSRRTTVHRRKVNGHWPACTPAPKGEGLRTGVPQMAPIGAEEEPQRQGNTERHRGFKKEWIKEQALH
ncbi:hypothetical protein SY85_12595 [Flavisolibacter tropicus]|uniref:Uncharacterized protein n=1 Tax=Flavisolibacter tropicus TaxID=1492898 RepID=A0A172TW22_9BACT|nr:hypothetical protein SY85_12595 [Flavisolibacter tropicus]